MESTRKLWIALAALLVVSFGVLLWAGSEIFRAAPPIPEKVVSVDGTLAFTPLRLSAGALLAAVLLFLAFAPAALDGVCAR